MIEELENRINDSFNNVIQLNGDLVFDVDYRNIKNKVFPFNGLIDINHSNVILDGSNSTIYFTIRNLDCNDLALFYIHPNLSNIEFRNLSIKIKIEIEKAINSRFMGIFNSSKNFKFINSNIEIVANNQVNLIALYNYGNTLINSETFADFLLVDNNIIKVYCKTEEHKKRCYCYGIYNDFANSILVTNNQVFSTLNGNSDLQRAIGIYTSGNYGRFIGNNIKTNGLHSSGLELEQASTYGFINQGNLNIITSNNIIAEWAGKAIGIENHGEEALINSNKILSTHNIFGRCIRNYSSRIIIDANMLVSTSKNARIVEHNGSNSVISNNIMNVLIPTYDCQSGCGIYAANKNCFSNSLSGNLIINVKTCGIFVKEDVGILENNQVGSKDTVPLQVICSNVYYQNLLDEKNIRTLEIN